MNEDFFKLIEQYDTITIFGHIYPDGDCYGSEIGLRETLRHFYPNKKIYALGSGFKRRPKDFPGMDEVDDETIKNSLAIIVDLAGLDRLEDKRATTALALAKVDHHIFQQAFGVVDIVKEDYVSATLILAEMLIDHFGYVPKSAAGPLLLGLITDSGRFLYQPIDSKILITAAKLAECGASFKEIYDVLYLVEEKSLRFKGYIFLNYLKHPSGIAYMVLSKEKLAEFGYDSNSAAGFVNSIASIEGMKVWVFFTEGQDGIVRVELRSSGFPVQPIAVHFGGGGHLCASGCRLDKLEKYQEVIDYIAQEIEKGE